MNSATLKKPRRPPADILLTPAKQKKLAIGLFVVGSFIALSIKGPDVVDYLVHQHERSVLLPKMAALAAEGKTDAIIWMTTNDSAYRAAHDYVTLQKAAEAGNPQSMYLYGAVLEWRKDQLGAEQWYSRAAAEGYPAAVLRQSEKNQDE